MYKNADIIRKDNVTEATNKVKEERLLGDDEIVQEKMDRYQKILSTIDKIERCRNEIETHELLLQYYEMELNELENRLNKLRCKR